MANASSRLTTQGQISVPAEIRRKLGLGPGAVLEWHEIGGEIVVRRAGRYSSADIRNVLFPQGVPAGQGPVDTKAALRAHARERYARR